jgi:hypothetical protein
MSDPHPTRYRFGPDVVMRDIEGGLVVVDLGSGGTWKVNDTGAAICREIERGATVPEIGAVVAARFQVSSEVAVRDVGRLLGELEGQGLVQKTSP